MNKLKTDKHKKSLTRSPATAEIARDEDDIDFSVDDLHSALTLAFNSFSMHTPPNSRY